MATPPEPQSPLRPSRPASARPKRDYAAEEEAARRLTSAHIQLRRGLTAEAEAAVRTILATRPEDAGAHELLGDTLAARGDWDGAIGAYQSALTLEPGRTTAESKFATATLRRAERQRQQTLGVAYAATDTAMVRREGGERGAWPIIVGSVICPGLGQIVQGQTVKGVALVAVFVLCLGLLALLPHGTHGASYFSFGFWLVAVILAGDWLYAVADAVTSAKIP
jgi:tetratricopeptide (TPR) repeat protein